jgi:hypothetical protein
VRQAALKICFIKQLPIKNMTRKLKGRTFMSAANFKSVLMASAN